MPAPKQVHRVKIGGEDRPVKFGFNAIAIFNDLTDTDMSYIDRKFNPPADVQAELIRAQKEDRKPDVDWQPAFTASELRALVYAGLADGARKKKQEVDFDVYDVGDWIDERPEAVQEVFGAYQDAQDAGEEEEAGNVVAAKAA